jgi:eukaryotic-like serine/threonine-protein kinase
MAEEKIFNRRLFTKLVIFGSSGSILALVLSRFYKYPNLTKIQFTSVKIDEQGNVVERPTGNAEVFTESLGNKTEIVMVKIPSGKFLMGQSQSERQYLDKIYAALPRGAASPVIESALNSELPQHQVNIPTFFIGQTLVTRSQWQKIMGNNPSEWNGDGSLPVNNVSWIDSINFCYKLSRETGRNYRLPSEAEWEYACRAGSTTPFTFGEVVTPEVVNSFTDNKTYPDPRTHSTIAGSFPPNMFGLYDVHSNLYQWCADEFVDSYNGAPIDGSARGDININPQKENIRVVRGGYNYFDRNCNAFKTCYFKSVDGRSASRNRYGDSFRDFRIGLRLACTL